MKTQKLIDTIIEQTDITIANTIKNIPELVCRQLKKVIIGALGFEEDGFNRWRVRKNKDNEPLVSKYINETAREAAMRCCDKIITDEFIEKIIEDKQDTLEREFKRVFNEQVRVNVNALVDRRVEQLVNGLFDKYNKQATRSVERAFMRLGGPSDILSRTHSVVAEHELRSILDDDTK